MQAALAFERWASAGCVGLAPRTIADGNQSAILHDILDLSRHKQIEAAAGKRSLKLRREVAKKLERFGIVDCILRGDRATSWQRIAAKLKQTVVPKQDDVPADPDLIRLPSRASSKALSARRAEYRKTHAEKVRQAARLCDAKSREPQYERGDENSRFDWLDQNGFN